MTRVVNKYGITVILPPTKETPPVLEICRYLNELGVSYQTEYCFDEKGCRNMKYDIAVFDASGNVAFFIEYDGAAHYSTKFYAEMGNRDARNKVHVVKSMIADAKKDLLAMQHGIPVLRLNSLHMENLREKIISYVEVFTNKNINKNNEIAMVEMFDHFGWDFYYVPPAEPSKVVEEYLKEREVRLNEIGDE